KLAKALGDSWNESEGTEVKKGIEWLKEETEKRIKTIESDDISFVGSEYYDEGYIDGMRDVLYRINQLDEPEVLSQEWLWEHVDYADVRGSTQAFIHVEDLKNLLVPKYYAKIKGHENVYSDICFWIY